jgi:hypothetical protein
MKTISAEKPRPIAGRIGLIFAIITCGGLAVLDQTYGYQIAAPDKIVVSEVGLYALMTIFILWLIFFKWVLDRIDACIDYAKSLGVERLQFRQGPTVIETILSGAFVISIIAFPINAFFLPHLASKMIQEDSIIEDLTSIFYLISTAACLILIVRAKGKGWLRFNLGVLAFLFFFVGMEEISWGQRIFNFGTPAFMAKINNQDEFTIHNLYSISLFQYPGLVITAFLLCVFPLWQKYSRRWSGLLEALQFPVAPTSCAWLYLGCVVSYFALGFIFKTPTPLPIAFGDYMPSSDDEYLEFYLSCLFLIFSITNWRIILPRKDR